MGVCVSCGTELDPGEKFCQGCGKKVQVAPVRMPDPQSPGSERSIKSTIDNLGDVSYAIFGLPFGIFGLAFAFAGIAVAVGAMPRSFAYGIVGMFWALIIGGIIAAIGSVFIKRITNDTIRTWAGVILLLGSIIGAVLLYPGYAATVSAFY